MNMFSETFEQDAAPFRMGMERTEFSNKEFNSFPAVSEGIKLKRFMEMLYTVCKISIWTSCGAFYSN